MNEPVSDSTNRPTFQNMCIVNINILFSMFRKLNTIHKICMYRKESGMRNK